MSTCGMKQSGYVDRAIFVLGLNDLAELICRGFMVESAEETAISLHESFYFNGNWKVKKSRRDVFFSACAGFSVERSVWQKSRDFQWSEVCGKNLGKLSGRETGETSGDCGLAKCHSAAAESEMWISTLMLHLMKETKFDF